MALATDLVVLPAAITSWFEELEPMPLAQAIRDPGTCALFSADMVVGFCEEGDLASERVGALVEPVADLFRRAHAHGVRRFVLLQDTHAEQTPEFDAFPPHCVRGTPEARTVAALADLPFAGACTVFEKNSLHPAVETGFDAWLDANPDVSTAVVVGNCTDLCVYQLAMHLRLRANARNIPAYRVVVPASCVQTYDLPEGTAPGPVAHPGDFFHVVFLYHLALNGIEVVAELS